MLEFPAMREWFGQIYLPQISELYFYDPGNDSDFQIFGKERRRKKKEKDIKLEPSTTNKTHLEPNHNNAL